MTERLRIPNRSARRLLLAAQGLAETPTGQIDLDSLIKRLGFVQLDSVRVVSRAHHHILWSRDQNYREPMLSEHMTRDRRVFEHFTHDASVIPMDFYPVWTRQFRRLEEKVRGWEWHRGMLERADRETIKDRIRKEGPLSTKAFDTKVLGRKKMWARPPHKLTLDYLWYAGELSTAHRENFIKFYDLSERIIPPQLRQQEKTDTEQINWLCQAALDRMGFGTEGDIQRFWDAVDIAEVKLWVAERKAHLVPVEIECVDGTWRPALAAGDIETLLETVPPPTSRLRILNPFDPVVRDRTRLQRLFGFEYKVEMFVPAKKRQWGYYVYPLLEGDRFIGRVEVKADRKTDQLVLLNLWPEPGVKWTAARAAKLQAELQRLARLASVQDTVSLTD